MEQNELQLIHCTELMTGKNLTGFFSLRDDHIGVKIYSYDDPFYINTDAPIILRTEDNEVVTLHENVGGPPGNSYRPTTPPRICYRQDIISNIAVIGHDAWTEDDRVREVTFSINHSGQLLHHGDKFKKLGLRAPRDEDSWHIFNDRAGDLYIKVHYAATYGMHFDAPKSVLPCFSIEFCEPATISEYISSVSDYCRFLSFCLGAPLSPSDFHIDRMPYDEKIAAIQAGSYPGDHKVQYVWPQSVIDSHDLWIGGSPVLVWDDDELAAFRVCLVMWMERVPSWRKAYALMEACLKKKDVISSERLVNACRWFEEIPLAASKQAISDEDIRSISVAAAQAAGMRGIDESICHRIKGAIKRIKAETAEEQFRRLVKLVQGKFGPQCLPYTAIPHLKRAIAFRGKTAHGLYIPKDETEFRALVTAISALEALCFLLTAYDLPINGNGIERMHSNPLIRDYLRMTLEMEGQPPEVP
ncbi:ApeA N-terminal domain 1-containing protein [Humidesulfovibrio sp.]